MLSIDDLMTTEIMLINRLLGVVREEGPADAARAVTPGIRAAVPLAGRAGVAAFLHEVAYLLESNGGQS